MLQPVIQGYEKAVINIGPNRIDQMTLEVPLLGSETPVCARGLAALVRASVHYYNGETEVERFVRGVAG